MRCIRFMSQPVPDLPLLHAVEGKPVVVDTWNYPCIVRIVVLPQHFHVLPDIGGFVGIGCAFMRSA